MGIMFNCNFARLAQRYLCGSLRCRQREFSDRNSALFCQANIVVYGSPDGSIKLGVVFVSIPCRYVVKCDDLYVMFNVLIS